MQRPLPTPPRLDTSDDISTISSAPNDAGASGADAASNLESPPLPPSAHIRRNYVGLLSVSLYTILTLYSWTVICILSIHPLDGPSYRINQATYNIVGRVRHTMTNNEHNYRAARVIGAVLAVLTLPIATTVCARAAVVYSQRKRRNFTIRQAVALGDKGWISPDIWIKVMRSPRKYGSVLLWLSIALHLLGFTVAPLQQLFLSTRTIKTPSSELSLINLVDLPDLINPNSDDNNNYVILLRDAIQTSSLSDPNSYIWFNKPSSCNSSEAAIVTATSNCVQANNTRLGYLNDTNLPFTSQLAAGFNTGLTRQFAPRLNSTVLYEVTDRFPADCGDLPDAFYAEYNGSAYGNEKYRLRVCMPSNQTFSPWNRTRDRQDISEELYISVTTRLQSSQFGPLLEPTVFRIQVNSTAGYFELPNYMNGNAPGPLIENDVGHGCDESCVPQFPAILNDTIFGDERPSYKGVPISVTANPNADVMATMLIPNTTDILDLVPDKPPLLALAIALFGSQSYIATRTKDPAVYTMTSEESAARLQGCIAFSPLAGLIDDATREPNDVSQCLSPAINGSIPAQLGDWLSLFSLRSDPTTPPLINPTYPIPLYTPPVYEMAQALTAAIFLANNIWLTKSTYAQYNSYLQVTIDLGVDTAIPSISRTGIIATSTLLGIFITALFAMALYGSYVPVWTPTLDSFAMMRIGAAMADDLPLLLGEEERVGVMDEMPGWIGDTEPDDGRLGRLGLGATTRLMGKRLYRAYPKPIGKTQSSKGGRRTWFRRIIPAEKRGRGEKTKGGGELKRYLRDREMTAYSSVA